MCPSCYEQQRRRIGWESSYVDAQPVREHILALRAAGVGNKRLRQLSGVSHNTIQAILTGRPERKIGPTKQVLRRTTEKILAVPIPDVPHALASGGVPVPVVGTRRRLRALVTIGWSRAELMRRLGHHDTNGYRWFTDECEQVSAANARAVEKLFNELQLVPGMSSRARNEGKRRGWAPPLAWDEGTIDDPAAEPNTGARVAVPFPERYRELKDCGYSDLLIAQKLGIQPPSLLRQLNRYGLTADPALVEEATSRKWAARKQVAS